MIAAVTFFPIFRGLTHYANPAVAAANATSPVVVVAAPDECSFQFDPVGGVKFTSSCDVAKSALAGLRVPYSNEAARLGSVALVKIGSVTIASFDGSA